MYPNLLTAVCASCTSGWNHTARAPHTGRNPSRIPPGQAYAVAGSPSIIEGMEDGDGASERRPGPAAGDPIICTDSLPARLDGGMHLFLGAGSYEDLHDFSGASPARCG